MPKKKTEKTEKKVKDVCCTTHNNGAPGAIYGLGFAGALIYFLGKATTFSMGVIGFLKAMVWPGFLIYNLFKYLGI